ncbi:MAG: hypothetical protein KGL35_03255 [Bradyrhizobium sp.]|nr:hypothetical protein [Bradyrhizobium sp.]
MAAPSWSDAINVQPVALVAVGATLRATLNVQNKFGAKLFIRAMRLSASAPSNGLYVAVRRILNGTPAGGAAGVDITHSKALLALTDVTTASSLTTLNGAPTIPGSTVTLTTAIGFAGNQHVGIVNSATTPTVIEFARTSKISANTLTLDRPLTNTGLGTGNTITNNAFILPPVTVEGTPGNAEIEVIFDNGLETTVAYAVEVWAQTLDSVA